MKLMLILILAFNSVVGGGYLSLPDYVEGEVLVKFRAGVSKASVRNIHTRIGAQVIRSVSLDDGEVQRVKLPNGLSVMEAIRLYLSDPAVEYAEPNYIVRKAERIPNDPFFSLQWGLRNVGQMVGGLPGVSGVDIGASHAWQTCTGGNVIVAVLDTGVDYNHPDLRDNVWRNAGETSCNNNVDDDNNSYVDDCFGWNFANNNNNPMDDDSDGHGTHVAGVIGAVGNNGAGVSGVNWSVKIMPVKFLDAQGYGTVEQAARAIRYAADMGAKVINASYAYPGGCYLVPPSITERNALEYARSKGVIVVSASGNYGCNNDNTPFYPASHKLDNVLSASASSSTGNLPSWSNYGLRSVHFAAPGVKIYSTIPSGQYGFLSGTSMATPFVSGALAMLFSCRPELSYLQIREILLSTTMTLEDFKGTTISGGMLRLDRALQSQPVPAKPTLLSISHSTGSITLTFQDNSYMEEGFVVQRGISENNMVDIAFLPSREGSYDTLVFTDSQVQAGNTYHYRVCSYAGSNRSCSHTLLYTIASLQPPQNNAGGGGGGGCNAGSVPNFLTAFFYILFVVVFRRLFMSR